MKWVCRMKKNHQMPNDIDTLIIRKDLKEYKKIDINIIKKEYGILINIHRIWHHKTIIP
jgi:UDP-N-acetyl-D-mannosaminuronate dehydrogenase